MLSTIVKQGQRWLQQAYLTENYCKPLFGLDIDSNALRLVELSQRANQLVLERYVIETLPQGVIENQALSDLDKVATAIRNAWKKLGNSCRATAIAIPTTMAFHKTLRIPTMDSERLDIRVADEIRQLVTFDRDEINLDFQILAIDNDELEVLVCAARRETVEERVAAVELAGLSVALVDVECFASIAALEQILPVAARTHQALALLDINNTHIQYHVISQHQPIYYRNQLLTNPLTDTLTPETQRSLHSFFNTLSLSHTDQICHIFLAGSPIPATLIDEIEQRTGIHPQTADPFGRMIKTPSIQQLILEKEAPSLLVACGLALRRFG